MSTPSTPHGMSRRDALKLGGTTLSLAALVAACGEDRTGDTAPGRVGNAPEIEPLEEFEVNDVVLLRTASSLENTAVAVYETAKTLVDFDEGTLTLVDRLIANHTATAARMGELTVAAGGVAWEDTNPWYMQRTVEPVLELIAGSDDVARDVTTFAITLENLATATHQTFAHRLSTSEQRTAVSEAAAQEARHSATLVLETFGTAFRFAPELVGGESGRMPDNTLPQYAVNSRFGSVAQKEMIIGAPDENGTRTTLTVATPAANSYVYEEL